MKRQRNGWLGTCAGVWLGLAVVTAGAMGQGVGSTLPADIMTTSEPFSAGQKDRVNRYIEAWAGELVVWPPETPGEVSRGREKLLEPLTQPGASEAFKDQYSALLITQVRPGASSAALAVRLNTFIVVARSIGAYGVDLASGALADPSPAVRYWAARAVADGLDAGPGQPGIELRRQRQLHATIRKPLGEESACAVREQLYRALAAMEITDAWRTLLEALMSRTEHYGRHGISDCLRAEKTGLNRLYSRVILAYEEAREDRSKAQRAKMLREQLKRLGIVAHRYVQLVERAVSAGAMADDTRVIGRDVVASTQVIMTEALNAVDADDRQTPNLPETYSEGKVEFALAVAEWRAILVDALEVDPGKLELPDRQREGDGQPDDAEPEAGGADGA